MQAMSMRTLQARPVARAAVRPRRMATVQVKASNKFYDFDVKDIDGKSISLSKYKGKVVLVVNLASACGFTPQYAELQDLHNKYASKGLAVVGFPCNQFGAQEPGNESSIKKFAQSNYGVKFDLMSKVDVNGPGAAPVFNWLKTQKGGLLGNDIKWNFSKFLVDKNGDVFARYPSTTAPTQMVKDIEKLL